MKRLHSKMMWLASCHQSKVNDMELIPKHDQERSFWEFQREEFSKIAEAHFNTIQSISSFFQYYLIIMSAPLAVISVAISLKAADAGTSRFASINAFHIPLAIVFFSAALLGMLVMWYIANLRGDSILYARTINAKRRMFWNEGNFSWEGRLRLRVLPEDPHSPPYYEVGYFYPVVLAFAVVDGGYFLAGLLAAFNFPGGDVAATFAPTLLPDQGMIELTVGVILMHMLLYYCVCLYRERYYLRSNIIGTDIDGVLNLHRRQFAAKVTTVIGRSINENDIKRIPVHKDRRLRVSDKDERSVFNDIDYWISMPPMEGAAESIRKIKKELKLKVYIFTHRPWPVHEDTRTKRELETAWKTRLAETYPLPRPLRWIPGVKALRYKRPIRVITKIWLQKAGIGYRRLWIEGGSRNSFTFRRLAEDRFSVSKKHRLQFFVDDNVNVALELSNFCDTVFLMDQPYNRHIPINSARNIVRVTSWDEIYRYIRTVL